jgi:hypothetical protein
MGDASLLRQPGLAQPTTYVVSNKGRIAGEIVAKVAFSRAMLEGEPFPLNRRASASSVAACLVSPLRP